MNYITFNFNLIFFIPESTRIRGTREFNLEFFLLHIFPKLFKKKLVINKLVICGMYVIEEFRLVDFIWQREISE